MNRLWHNMLLIMLRQTKGVALLNCLIGYVSLIILYYFSVPIERMELTWITLISLATAFRIISTEITRRSPSEKNLISNFHLQVILLTIIGSLWGFFYYWGFIQLPVIHQNSF